MFFHPHRRTLYRVLWAPALAAALVGCRGRAQRDVYEAKMAHEIRVLEDQLYEADYHNRVLIDKLEQIRLKSEPASKYDSTGSRSYDSTTDSVPEPIQDPLPNASGLIPPELPDLRGGGSGAGPAAAPRGRSSTPSSTSPLDDLGDLGAIVDEGQPADPADVAPAATDDPFADDPKSREAGEDESSPPMDSESSGELLPAPGGPEPPSKSDTEIPPVLPGEVLPPSIHDEQDDKPPGQIQLPDSVQDAGGMPDQLRLHPSLSGGRRVDGKVEDMMVVVNVLDQRGRPLDLSQFYVEAELSVVLFEADQNESDEARIGRWDFTSEQVVELIKTDPISGLHVPIEWKGRHPEGDEVVVHIRLRAEEDEMRCEGRLKVVRANAVAEWTPRGESLK